MGTVNPILPVLTELVQQKCDVRYYLSKESTRVEVTVE